MPFSSFIPSAKRLLPLAVGVCFSLAAVASHADDDLAALKAQIAAQQAQLDAMMQQLQALQQKQAATPVVQTATPPVTPAQAHQHAHTHAHQHAPTGAVASKGNPFSDSAMNPDISFIIDASLVGRGVKQDQFGKMSLKGFTHGFAQKHDGHSHASMMNMEQGFNLNYGELNLFAAVDNYFDLFAAIHVAEEGAELEEAYIKTRSLPAHFQVKAGKFLSSFGRLNDQHHHVWDFADQPLIYQGVFGGHGLLEKGAQLTWLAPTDTYLQLGVEALHGDNEQSFGRDELSGTQKKSVDGVGAWVAFAKTSFDIGDSSWIAGLSYAQGQYRHVDGDHGKAGDSHILGVDLTGKYFIDAVRYVQWQSEYIQRNIDNAIKANYNDDGDLLRTAKIKQQQSGYYTQLIWKFQPQWRVGARYDAIADNRINAKQDLAGDRHTLMVDYSPTEFSRIRLQYARNEAYSFGGQIKPYDEILLQLNMTIGAHGAHSF